MLASTRLMPGKFTTEMKAIAAMTGELFGAALEQRVGDKTPRGIIVQRLRSREILGEEDTLRLVQGAA